MGAGGVSVGVYVHIDNHNCGSSLVLCMCGLWRSVVLVIRPFFGTIALLYVGNHYTRFSYAAPCRLWAVVVRDGFARCASILIRCYLATKGRYTYCSVNS